MRCHKVPSQATFANHQAVISLNTEINLVPGQPLQITFQ